MVDTSMTKMDLSGVIAMLLMMTATQLVDEIKCCGVADEELTVNFCHKSPSLSLTNRSHRNT